MKKTRMIVDCDPGHDDALALLLANRFADLVGITTVFGNAALGQTTSNALGVAAMMGAKCEVYAGASRPLNRTWQPEDATEVHGETGLDGVVIPVHRWGVAEESAKEFLLNRVDTETWIVAIGPLTNVAEVINSDPDWPTRIRGISIMGGSASSGNVTPVAEFNVYSDPEAAEVVFNSGAVIRLSDLNLTHQFMMTEADANEIAQRATPGNFGKFAADSLHEIQSRLRALTGQAAVAMHDPCAVLAVTHANLFDFVRRSIHVELEGKLTRGMTVVDQRLLVELIKSPTNVELAERIDHRRARTLLMQSLCDDPILD